MQIDQELTKKVIATVRVAPFFESWCSFLMPKHSDSGRLMKFKLGLPSTGVPNIGGVSKISNFDQVAIWRSGSAFVLITEVNVCGAWLVLGWVTVSRFDSRGQHFISICKQPCRLTQPSTVYGMVK